MDFFQLLATIRDRFQSLWPFIQKPGVFKVLADAINGGWSDIEVQDALQHTEYFLNTPIAARQWDALQATDPATATQKAALVKRTIDDLEKQLGVKLDTSGGLSSPGFQFFVDAVRNGWDANEIKYRMIAMGGTTKKGGAVGATAAHIRSLANDYGVPLSDQAIMDWANQLAEGAIDDTAIQGYLIEQAKSLYPGLSDALDRGITVRQYANPYLQLAAQELNIDPSTINLTDGKWMSALNQIDPKTGARVSMSLDQWLSELRTNPIYGYDKTNNARQSATQLATALGQKFGSIG